MRGFPAWSGGGGRVGARPDRGRSIRENGIPSGSWPTSARVVRCLSGGGDQTRASLLQRAKSVRDSLVRESEGKKHAAGRKPLSSFPPATFAKS
jgi:hypothetical protein